MAVAYGGSSLLCDKENIWLLCSGDAAKNETGGLFCIHPGTLKIVKQWTFANPGFNPVKLKQNPAQDSLYFLYKGIFGFPKTASLLPASPFISEASGANFYGFTVHPVNGNIVVADAADFISRGKILVYLPNGTFIKSYGAGVVPAEFLWW